MHAMIQKAEVGSIVRLPLILIKPNPDQPRKYFDPLSIESLGHSCRKKEDVEQPILVVKCEGDKYVMIVDGERRWRAANHVGLETISCFIKPPMSSIDMFIASAVTNFGREDMSPIEEAFALKRIMDEKGMNQSELAFLVGKHPAQISNMLKYLKLNREVQSLVITRKLDKGVALQLATYNPGDQISLLKTLEKEVEQRGGKKIHPNEASRFLRGVAEKRGLGTAPANRGRELKSHADLITRSMTKCTEVMQKSLQEFNALSVKSIKEVKGSHFLDVLQELKGLRASIDVQIARLEKMD
jgi:ParB family chromosome partitioning protein